MYRKLSLMNSSVLKIGAVAVVCILVMAGMVYFMTKGGNSEKKVTYTFDGSLPVMGNANEDYLIDNSDLEIINKIVRGDDGYTIGNYPMADADNDSKVTSADRDVVKNIIDGKETLVYVYNYSSAKGMYLDTVHWPVKNAVTAGASTILIAEYISGVSERIVGVTYDAGGVDEILFPKLSKTPSLGPNQREFDFDAVSNLVTTDNVTALISAGWHDNFDDFKRIGVDIICPSISNCDPSDFSSSMLLLGFVFNINNQALEVSQWYKDLMDEINGKLPALEDRKKVMGTIMATWAIPVTSAYTDIYRMAGGVPTTYVSTAQAGFMLTISDWINDDDADFILGILSQSAGNSIYKDGRDDSGYSKSMKTCYTAPAFLKKQVSVIFMDLPIPLRIMYAAAAIYPELFSEEWADQKHQDFVDRFYAVDIDLSDKDFLLVYDELYPNNA